MSKRFNDKETIAWSQGMFVGLFLGFIMGVFGITVFVINVLSKF